ncbi:MAG: hypothetical protein GY854_31055 [Deltaproteobacteria bacterium]|nr:hypothetical protein [Deltaproteobacteria bacterium]
MNRETSRPCRKCGSPNPLSNEYCRQCGAVLDVATAEVKAQRRPILPAVKEIHWRWVGMSALVTLGLMAILMGVLSLVAWLVFDVINQAEFYDFGAMTNEFAGLAIAAVTLFIISFGLGGLAIAWITKQHTVIEPTIAAFVVLTLLGVVGSSVTDDALWAVAVMLVPSAALAGLGGHVGELLSRPEKK